MYSCGQPSMHVRGDSLNAQRRKMTINTTSPSWSAHHQFISLPTSTVFLWSCSLSQHGTNWRLTDSDDEYFFSICGPLVIDNDTPKDFCPPEASVCLLRNSVSELWKRFSFLCLSRFQRQCCVVFPRRHPSILERQNNDRKWWTARCGWRLKTVRVVAKKVPTTPPLTSSAKKANLWERAWLETIQPFWLAGN